MTPELARRFHGSIVVHDVEDPELIVLDGASRPPLRVNPAIVETDLVVVVTAAESVLHGGPAALLGAAGADALRAAGAYSLLETTASQGWHLAVALERTLAQRVPLIGVSLVLNHPEVSGALRGYPYDPDALERVARSPLRHVFSAMPDGVRRTILRSVPTESTAAAAFGGPPSVAHAEALLRAVELRRTELDRPLDAIVIGVPGTTPFLPRERPNPLIAAYLGLGLALRMWRDAFPWSTAAPRSSSTGSHAQLRAPDAAAVSRVLPRDAYGARPEAPRRSRAQLSPSDPRAIASYRSGRTVHPLLPFRDWNACQPALGRLGAVIVAGTGDAAVVRQLGFVPAHGVGAALLMAHGRAGREPRIGFLLSPPYFPLRVGGGRTGRMEPASR